jgi:nucleoside-diphosphate-sugar epimerase
MAQHAFIIGGTGQIGRAAAKTFLGAGWHVTISHRGTRPVPPELGRAQVVTLDRDAPGALAAALGAGADVVIDTVAFDAAHGAQLLEVQGSVGSFVVMSSISVYCDAQGRGLAGTLERAGDLPVPIPETNMTVLAGTENYSTKKIALEQVLLQGSKIPVSILRPGAIHGIGSAHPREWWFVKRFLDGRRKIPLKFGGESRFSTSATGNLAALVQFVAETPGTRILNAVDPETLTVAAIGQVVAAYMGVDCEFLRLGPQPDESSVGATPWSVPRPFVAADTAARALGYVPVETYAQSMPAYIDWMIDTAARDDWRRHFTVSASYEADGFDYAAEDALLTLPL